MQSLLYREMFGSPTPMVMGMGLIIDLIKETKDPEYIEIFKEDFLHYFAIPVRKERKISNNNPLENKPGCRNRGTPCNFRDNRGLKVELPSLPMQM